MKTSFIRINSLLIIAVLSLIISSCNSVDSGYNESTTDGGNWHQSTTWQEGMIPSDSESVKIEGTVDITEDATCDKLIITETAVLKINPGAKLIANNIKNLGEIENSGEIVFLEK